MNQVNEKIFGAIDEYLTYKISRHFDAYVLLLGLKNDSGLYMNFVGGSDGVEYRLYQQKGPAVFAFIDRKYRVLHGDEAKWIVDLARKLCIQYSNQLFDEN